MSHQAAFEDLAALADWSGGYGNAGVWSCAMLGKRWGWAKVTVHRFLVRAGEMRLIRLIRRNGGTNIILLKSQWDLNAVSLPKTPRAQITHSEQIAVTVVATHFDVAESYIRGIINSRSRRRGRPARARRDQDAVSVVIYLINTSGGFTAQQIRLFYGMHRRAIQHAAASIEDRRDNDPDFDASITVMEAMYRAADNVIRRIA